MNHVSIEQLVQQLKWTMNYKLQVTQIIMGIANCLQI